MFPQMRGLGSSAMAGRYGIASRAEAEAYLADPVLGPRLIALFEVLRRTGPTARQIFGTPDDLKFRSCATLFAALPDAPPVFRRRSPGSATAAPTPARSPCSPKPARAARRRAAIAVRAGAGLAQLVEQLICNQ